MPLFTRKLLYPFFLSNFLFCSLKSQVIIPLGTVASIISGTTAPVKLFKPFKFDTSTAIIGIDFTDSTNGREGKFSFIINNSQDLAELKKDWVFRDIITPDSNRGVFKVFYTSNKVIKSSWVIFPMAFSIVTKEGVYLFNPTLLTILHAKSPLVHSSRIDTLQSKSDYLKFYDSAKAIPSFLFLMEPEIVCDGSFEVSLKADSHILPEEVGESIINSCNKIKGESAFKVYLKQNEGTGDAKHKTYIVKCDRSLFEQFSDRNFEKANWAPATYTIQSFWRSL